MFLRAVLVVELQGEASAFAGRPCFLEPKDGFSWLVVIKILFPDTPAGLGIIIDRAVHW